MTDGRSSFPSSLPGMTRAERRQRQEATKRRAAHRSWPQRIVLALLIVAALSSFGVAATFGYGLYQFARIERVDVVLATRPPPGEPKNVLVIGSDSRESIANSELSDGAFIEEGSSTAGQRSDTIMIVQVDPRTESLRVLSLPRDLWLPIAGTDRSQRINTAYANGPQGVIDTIEENFDIPIHHYVEVNFAGFAGLVEALGGVPMWFDTPLRDHNSGLVVDSPGCHVLDPEMALAYARSRHLEYKTERGWQKDGTGDLGRITRQQVFLRRALDQVNGLGVGNLLTLNRLLNVVVHNTVIDRDLDLDTLVDLGTRFSSFEGNELETNALPVYPFTTSGGAAVLGLVDDEAQPILDSFRLATVAPRSPTAGSVSSTTTGLGTSDVAGDEPVSTTTTVLGVAPDAQAACK